MSKRGSDSTNEHARRKVRRILERRQCWSRILDSDSDSSDSSSGANNDAHVPETSADDPTVPPNVQSEAVASTDPIPEIMQEEPVPEVLSSQDPLPEKQVENSTSEIELDPELLQALGECTDDSPEFGDKILENLAKLWQPILKKGLAKDNKDKLSKDYLVPDNCRFLQAPKLNAEISAAVPDMVRNRDKGITANQQQLGVGITALNRALDCLLKGEDKKRVIQHLSNSCRLLSDLHSSFTQNRIKLITPSLDKSFLHVIHDSERDDTLFGNKLSDKIKAAKTIERQGLQIKKTNNPRASTSSSQASNSRQNSGNWTAPTRFQSNRGRGGWRKPPPPPPPPRRSYTQYAPAPQQSTRTVAANKPRPPAPQPH